jgi:hypothetical protein
MDALVPLQIRRFCESFVAKITGVFPQLVVSLPLQIITRFSLGFLHSAI